MRARDRYNLGLMRAHAHGVARDVPSAARLLRRAAAQGHAAALAQLEVRMISDERDNLRVPRQIESSSHLSSKA